MPIPKDIADLAEMMLEWRRHFHSNPELGFEEHETSGFVERKLCEWGIEVARLATTGVIGTLKCGTSSRTIGLRADMDALPMNEANDFAWRSRHEGRMHACGHDGHTAMLLGAARYLSATRRFDGTVHFIFQPAEEGLAGARVMIKEGLFQRFPCDFVFAAHNDPLLPAGKMKVVKGPVMAASDRFTIRIVGRGGHAARPHHTIDPVIAGAHVAVALQSIVSRRIDPLESAVLSITQFHAGTTGNVIPDEAVLSGTVRTCRPDIQDQMERLLCQVAQSAAATQGATASVDFKRGYPPVVNADDATERAAAAAVRILGDDGVIRVHPPAMGGEDFAFMALERPACLVRIGQASDSKGAAPLHSSRYDFNDDVLTVGAAFWTSLVEQELALPT